jgi:hypothetical protein
MAHRSPNNTAQTGTYHTNSGSPYVTLGPSIPVYRTFSLAITDETWSTGDTVGIFISDEAGNWAVWTAVWDFANQRLASTGTGASVETASGSGIPDQATVTIQAVVTATRLATLAAPSLAVNDLSDVNTDSVTDGQVLTYNSGLWAGAAAGGGGGGGRTILAADRIYYVDATNGLDTNNGLAVGTAFQTAAKAINTVLDTLDLAGFKVEIQFRAGTYLLDNNVVRLDRSPVGLGVQPSSSTAPQFIITRYASESVIFTVSASRGWLNSPYITGGVWDFRYVTFRYQSGATSGAALWVFGAKATFSECSFNCHVPTPPTVGTYSALEVRYGAQVTLSYCYFNNLVTNGVSPSIIRARERSLIQTGSGMTISSSPVSNTATIWLEHQSTLVATAAWTGTCYGKRHQVNRLSLLDCNGAFAMPGDTAGGVLNGGIYYGT